MGHHGAAPHTPLLILEMGLQKKTARMAGWRWESKLACAYHSIPSHGRIFSLASGQIHHRKDHTMAFFTIVLCGAIDALEKFAKINDRKEKI